MRRLVVGRTLADMKPTYGWRAAPEIAGFHQGGCGKSPIGGAAGRWDNRRMLNRPADLVAALLALAAIALSLVTVVGRGGIYMWPLVVLAMAMLVVGAWWLNRQQPGSPFREMALPAAVATVMPLLVEVIRADWYGPFFLAAWILSAVAALTLGVRLADSVTDAYRLPLMLATAFLALLAGALGILTPFEEQRWAVVALAATTAVPGLVAGVIRHSTPSTEAGRGSVVPALELGVIGLTPAIAVFTMWGSGGVLQGSVQLIAWILFVLAAQFLAVRPLVRTASVATTQRDIVVAAMEAERSRIAADIHDDALQELTLLGWRLDATGNTEAARTAREVADRLRAICGDLRLPILDDLGAGPALEWLVERVGRLAGGEVRLERGDQVRPPPDVELAFFRVAQEALSNAVRHGRPPIVIRYWTSPSGASLSIDDSGAGFDPVRTTDVDGGHYGLMNMRQRAEQIGALLDVRRWPAGGTQVALEWRAQ
jgi:signal transduction histidine kinase